jgi:hypothetical protein
MTSPVTRAPYHWRMKLKTQPNAPVSRIPPVSSQPTLATVPAWIRSTPQLISSGVAAWVSECSTIMAATSSMAGSFGRK